MKFRFKIVDGDNEFFTDWKDDDSTQVAGTNQMSAPVQAVSDLRLLYPDAAFTVEHESVVRDEERAAITAKWMSSDGK